MHKLQEEISLLKSVAEEVLSCRIELSFATKTNNGGGGNDDGETEEPPQDSQAALVKKVFRGTIIEGENHEPNGSV
ncbi:MAG TPA: hypothetical protein ENN41_05065 [Sediminispirochaeta sp.]|nr:hypothetical protein [Sediminispirochaeta sp.]